MRRLRIVLLSCWLLAPAGCDRTASGRAPEPNADPVVQVKTAQVEKGDVVDAVVAYGTVVPAPGAALTISRPFETKIARLHVNAGQRVAVGDALVHFDLSPDTRLRVDDVGRSLDAATKELAAVQRRYDLGLATASDLAEAQRVLGQAQAEAKSLGSRGASQAGTITAPRAGLVSSVYAQEGALVPAGQPILDIVAEDAMEARVGIELARAAQVEPDDPVEIVATTRRDAVPGHGRVRSIAHAVDPATRLIAVSVTLTEPHFVLGEYVQARLPVARRTGLLVPRSAVLPEGDAYVLFTVEGGKAHRHTVRVGTEMGDTVEVVSSELHEGDHVITLGNYGCADGASVREAP